MFNIEHIDAQIPASKDFPQFCCKFTGYRVSHSGLCTVFDRWFCQNCSSSQMLDLQYNHPENLQKINVLQILKLVAPSKKKEDFPDCSPDVLLSCFNYCFLKNNYPCTTITVSQRTMVNNVICSSIWLSIGILCVQKCILFHHEVITLSQIDNVVNNGIK